MLLIWFVNWLHKEAVDQNSPTFSALWTGGGGQRMVLPEWLASVPVHSSICTSGRHARLPRAQMERARMCLPTARASGDLSASVAQFWTTQGLGFGDAWPRQLTQLMAWGWRLLLSLWAPMSSPVPHHRHDSDLKSPSGEASPVTHYVASCHRWHIRLFMQSIQHHFDLIMASARSQRVLYLNPRIFRQSLDTKQATRW